MAIQSFANRDTETVWLDKRVRRFQGNQARAKRKFNVLYAVATLGDLRNNRGAGLHRFMGDRASQWPVAINEQYRILFDWSDEPETVELTDYHQ